MKPALYIPFSLLLLFLSACETPQLQQQTDWLSHAPEIVNNSDSGSDSDSELSNVGNAHTHSGHR